MIYLQKDISTVSCGIIAHGTNCFAVMGSGVAKTLRNKYPIIFNPYALMCSEYATDPSKLLGKVCFVDVGLELTPKTELIIANCYTQLHYGRDGKQYANVDAVRISLTEVLRFANEKHLPVYLPRIGCGLGGLKWDQVRDVIERLEEEFPLVGVTICDI